ncbi:hypothetical protein [Blastococcus sp. SYSU DS0533]
MSAPEPGRPPSPTSRRERLVGLLVLGVAAVLLVSTPTWFASDQGGVAIAQLAVAVVLAAAGGYLLRRARRG